MYFKFEAKFGTLSKVHFRHTIYHFELGKSGVQHFNCVQVEAKMKKLWSFENNSAKLKAHFEMILKFNL